MKKEKITLTNSFHQSEATVLVPSSIFEPGVGSKTSRMEIAWSYLATEAHRGRRSQYLRAMNKLCGSHDCQCGGFRP